MSPDAPTPDALYGTTQIRESAKRLLDNYSNPWDPVAETVQNAVDAIMTEYRNRLATELDIPLSSDDDATDLQTAIETATEAVVDMDTRSFREVSNGLQFEEFEREGLENDARWGDEDYHQWVKTQYYESLGNSLGMDTAVVREADEAVREEYQGKLTVKRERDSRGIIVEDNGIGMSPNELEEALKRYGSLKSRGGLKTSQIGELGNGLTYVLTNCSDFSIETCDGETVTQASINGMLDWVSGEIDPEEVDAESEIIEENANKDPYTIVKTRGVREGESEFPDLFDERVTESRMVHLLRNKTAIGALLD